MSHSSLVFFSLLLIIQMCGCSSSLMLHEKSPARLVRSIELPNAGVPYRNGEGNIVLMQWKDGISFVSYNDSLDPIESFSLPLPDDIKYVAGCLTARNKYVLIGCRLEGDNLNLFGITINLSTRSIDRNVPLLQTYSWNEVKTAHDIFFRWNHDSTRFAVAVRKLDRTKKSAQIEGAVFDEGLHTLDKFTEFYEWAGRDLITIQELLFDRNGNPGVVRIEHTVDTQRIVYQQVLGEKRTRIESKIPSRIGSDTAYVNQTLSFVDSVNDLRLVAAINSGYELRGIGSLNASLDSTTVVASSIRAIPTDSAAALLGREKPFYYRLHSPFVIDRARTGFLAEQISLHQMEFNSPEVRQTTVTTYKSPGSVTYSTHERERVIFPARTQEVAYHWHGSIVLVILDDTGAVALKPLVTDRGIYFDAPLTKSPGQFLLHDNHVALPTTVHDVGNGYAVVYAKDLKDLYYAFVRKEELRQEPAQPLTHISGVIGLTWCSAITRQGADTLVIPALNSLFGKGTLLALRLP